VLVSRGRRIAAQLIADLLARVLTGPAAFLLGGIIDTLAFAGQSLRARLRRWWSRSPD
jgi:hypothetical protein